MGLAHRLASNILIPVQNAPSRMPGLRINGLIECLIGLVLGDDPPPAGRPAKPGSKEKM